MLILIVSKSILSLQIREYQEAAGENILNWNRELSACFLKHLLFPVESAEQGQMGFGRGILEGVVGWQTAGDRRGFGWGCWLWLEAQELRPPGLPPGPGPPAKPPVTRAPSGGGQAQVELEGLGLGSRREAGTPLSERPQPEQRRPPSALCSGPATAQSAFVTRPFWGSELASPCRPPVQCGHLMPAAPTREPVPLALALSSAARGSSLAPGPRKPRSRPCVPEVPLPSSS